MGGFEVYFMGVRIFSKLICGQWPNFALVTDKCQRIYQAYMSQDIIDDFETQSMIAIMEPS